MMHLRSLFGSIGIAAFCLPTLFAEGPPASYDLRSVNGGTQAWVPEVQNQGAAEDCWTFAAATAMNSNLLKTGLLPASPVPPPISISSWHLSTNNGAPDQLLGSLVPPSNQPIAYRVGSMRFHDQGYSNNVPFPSRTGTTTFNGVSIDTFTFDQGAADPQVAAVKDAILANGAATTCMNVYGNFQYGVGASGNTTQYFNDQTAPAWLNHSVTIIGWDDDYTMTDPSTSATTTGAWLVQMSNGVTTNYNGTFWASYNDAVIGRVGVSTYTLLDNASYSSTVIQNELGPTAAGEYFAATFAGPTTYLPIPSGMPTVAHHTAAAVLIPASDGELLAIGLFTQLADVLVQVEIFDSWDNGPSGFLGGGNYTLDDIGYFQVELPESLTLTAADSIVVQLTYLDALTLDPALSALGITIGGAGLNFDTNTNSVASGLSYYLDGSTWTDFATLDYPLIDGPGGVTGGVLFLKGITAVPEPSTLLLVLAAAAVAFTAQRVHRGPEAKENDSIVALRRRNAPGHWWRTATSRFALPVRARRNRHGPRLSPERLEQRIALAADGGRPLLGQATTLVVDASMGPSPVVFATSQVVGNDEHGFVVSHVPDGSAVEKWDAVSERWIDVTTMPNSSNPKELLRLLANRVIRQGDTLQWRPKAATEGGAQQAFQLIGWNSGTPPTVPSPQSPSVVRDLTVKTTGMGELTVTWDVPVSGAPTSYTVTMTRPGDGSLAQAQVTARTSVRYSGVSLQQGYLFSVTASNAEGTSPAAKTQFQAGIFEEGDYLINVESVAEYSGNPSVAVSGSGTSVLAWHTSQETEHPSDGLPGIRASFVDGRGSFLKSDMVVAAAPNTNYSAPATAINADGRSVIAWTQSRYGDGIALMVQRFDHAGIAVGSPIQVRQGESELWDVNIAIDSQGDFIVAWSESATSRNLSILAQRFSWDGDARTPAFLVDEGRSESLSRSPSIGMQGNGEFLIAWHTKDLTAGSSYNVFARAFAPAAQSPGSIVLIAGSPADEGEPDVVGLPDGNWAVAWTATAGDASGRAIMGRILAGDGSPIGTAFQINEFGAGDQQRVALAATVDAGFLAAWDGSGPNDSQGVFARRFTAEGLPAGEQVRLNGHVENVQNTVSIGIDDHDSLLAAWSSFNQAAPYAQYDIYAHAFENATQLGVSAAKPLGISLASSASLGASLSASASSSSAPSSLASAETVRFAVVGDWGYSDVFEGVFGHSSPMDYVGAMIRGWGPDFIVGLGDTNYLLGLPIQFDTNVGKNFSQYISPYVPQTSAGLALATNPVSWNRFFGVPGNHDYHDPFTSKSILTGREDYDSWFMASLTSSPNVVPLAANYSSLAPWNNYESYSNPYYDYRFSPIDSSGNALPGLANVYMIDGYQEGKGVLTADSMQEATILADAKARPNGAIWQIAASHFQNYSSSEGEVVGMDWDFFGNGFDLVFGAHVHNYERLERDGITYIVNGIGGFDFPNDEFSPLPDGVSVLPESRRFVNGVFGAMLVELSPTSLHAQVYGLNPNDLSGIPSVIDEFTMYKSPGTGISTMGMAISDGGFDGAGNTYSWEAMQDTGSGGALVGSMLTSGSLAYDVENPNQPDYTWAAGQTLPFAGSGTLLTLAAAAVNGSQTDQPLTLKFTDGTTATWTQSFSDWCEPQYYANESILSVQSYRHTASGGQDSTTNYVYSYGYTLPSGKTLESISLPKNPQVRILGAVLSEPSEPVVVSWNAVGLVAGNGQVGDSQGFDGAGNTYAAIDGQRGLGGGIGGPDAADRQITWGGATFKLGPTTTQGGQPNVVQADGQTFDVAAGDFSRLLMIGAAVNGLQESQAFTMTFSDGTTTTWSQSFSDWRNDNGSDGNPPPSGSTLASNNETVVAVTSLVDGAGNTLGRQNAFVYGYSYAIPVGKTLVSVTLPSNRNVGILGMSLV